MIFFIEMIEIKILATPCTSHKSRLPTNTTFGYWLFIPEVTDICTILKFAGMHF